MNLGCQPCLFPILSSPSPLFPSNSTRAKSVHLPDPLEHPPLAPWHRPQLALCQLEDLAFFLFALRLGAHDLQGPLGGDGLRVDLVQDLRGQPVSRGGSGVRTDLEQRVVRERVHRRLADIRV